MTELINKKENFKSYLKESLESGEESNQSECFPKFLNGELEAARASQVHLYVAQKIKSQSKKKKTQLNQKRVGLLVITNFRLCFVVYEHNDKQNDKNATKKNVSYQENNYLGRYDITLSNMDEIYAYTDKKHKIVTPQQKNGAKIDALRIVCKNFRVLTFDFSESEVGKGKYIADALVKFAFPARHNLLFLYHFNSRDEKNYMNNSNISRRMRTYRDGLDWIQELERCGISYENGAWRVLSLETISCENALPQNFVVPKHLTDSDYFDLCNAFRCKRGATWVWALAANGASLVRMADLLPDLLNNPKTDLMPSKDSLMLEHVRICAKEHVPPELMELTKGLPSIHDVYQSYMKLRALCAPTSDRELTIQDERFLTLLEKTCWLLYVSLCLKTANEAAGYLKDGKSVALQENDGRDMCCVISSLIQVLLDPYFRTITGFQVLIQKEWVALGHPFSDRIGHVFTRQQTDKSPLFLLFLDCVWQVLQQYPESFEFSPTFLTTIWDMVFVPIFDTFQFNCEYDRLVSCRDDRLVLHPVWDWNESFTDKDIVLFSNPLYKKPPMSDHDIELNRKSKLPQGALKLPGMDILPAVATHHRFSTSASSSAGLLPSQIIHQTVKPTINVVNTSNENNKYLEPSHHIRDLEIFAQCFYRWMPILEIRNGGFSQIDLYNRMLLNNIHKMQRALETGNFSDLQKDKNDDDGQQQKLPIVNSFFPFSINDTDNDANHDELNEILTCSSDAFLEGSVFDFE